VRKTKPTTTPRPLQLLRAALAFLACLVLFSFQTARAQTKDDLDPAIHVSRARLAVLEHLRTYKHSRLPANEVELKLLGAPVFLTQQKRMHKPLPKPLPQLPDETFDLPEAFVDFLIYREGKIVALVRVVFQDDAPSTNVPDSAFQQPFTQAEWDQTSQRLAEFNAIAPDITKGPERFYPYLPDDMRSSQFRDWMPESEAERLKLTDEDLRRYVAVTFDLFVHMTWSWLEGIDCQELCLPAALVERPKTAEGFRAATEQLSQAVAQMNQFLNDLGTTSPEHQAAMAPYTAALYRGPTDKRLNELRLPGSPPSTALYVPELPASTPLYVTGMAGWDLYFAEVNGRLMIVDADYD